MTNQNICNCGEYFIAHKLSYLDYTVTLTLGRAERFDILAVDSSGRTLKFSVKTIEKESVKGFPLKTSDEKGASSDFYYAFVKLKGKEVEPDYWIIPSKRINEVLERASTKYFKEYLKKDGQHPKDVGLRKLDFEVRASRKFLYDDNWETDLKSYYKNIKQLI